MKLVQEGPRRAEFGVPRALRQVAADRHQIGPIGVQIIDQRRHDRRILGAEMQVGEVGDPGHGACGVATGGAITHSARRRLA